MKLTPYTILKGIRYLKHYGIKDFWIKLTERMEPEQVPYSSFLKDYLPTESELNKQRENQKKLKYRPLLSIVVPTYQTPEIFLKQMVNSLIEQTYDNWQLCIADGSEDDGVEQIIKTYYKEETRIVYQRLFENKGISQNSNEGLKLASGDYIGLLDHDDLLAVDALYEVAAALNQQPDIDVIYTDEDKVSTDLKEYFQPHLKPDFNLDLLRSNNYITHFFLVKRDIVNLVGGFHSEFDGAQDYDFIFRCTEQAQKIHHIPKILYHWRVHSASTADNPMSKQYAFDAGARAIKAHLNRQNLEGEVSETKDIGFYKVRYPVRGTPFISIIIPNKDEIETLRNCLKSIETSSYTNYEIIIVENNSTKEETFSYYNELEKSPKIRVVYWKKSFNYSAINNFGAAQSNGEFFILLNNDIEIISKDWMETMVSNAQRQEVGIVGAKLYYPDDTIQHAGTVIGIGGIAGHVFTGMKRSYSGYFHKASIQQNYSAVTAACMMVKRNVYEELGGLDEKLSVAFNDVDFCIRAINAGYLIVYHPGVEAYHYESKSRGKEDSKEKVKRFQEEIEIMRHRHIKLLKKGDPYYNPNLSLSKWNYSLRSK